MKTKYKNKIFQLSAAFGCAMLLVTLAHGTSTPLDCQGVIAVKGGYRLTQNTTCNFAWDEDNNKVFNLNGFTLTATDVIYVAGIGQTIRNGVLITSGMNWGYSSNMGTLSNLMVKSASSAKGFFIEAGGNFTVKNCTFTNTPGIVLDFYYNNGGTVKNSTFIGNGTGISIQKSDGVLIEHNKFIGNVRGINLWDEDGGGVNDNKIQYNHFLKNELGIRMLALSYSASTKIRAMEDNQIMGNNFRRSRHSGLLIEVACDFRGSSVPAICGAQNTMVKDNRFYRNGFLALTDLSVGAVPDDDGVTARGMQFGTGIPFPEGLAGVTLSNNRADRNADLGFDVEGVTDGGGQVANLNGNPTECIGLVCDTDLDESQADWHDNISYTPLTIMPNAISDATLESDQLRHTQ